MAMASSLPPGFEGGAGMGSLSVAHHIPQTQVAKKAREIKKLSWASEDNLCQVRLFAAEDPPAQSNSTVQEMLLPKKARFMHMINPVVHVDLPPGFGPSTQMGLKPPVASIVPQVPWRVPELYKLDPSWLVMAGGESKEVTVQRQRENRVLEAVYPRPSAIPESPAEPSEPQYRHDYDDANTLIIPVVPLEDDDSPDPDDPPTTTGSTYDILEEYSFPKQKSVSPPPGFDAPTVPATKSRNWFPEAPQENLTTLPVTSTANVLGPPVSLSGNILPPNGTTMQTTMTNMSTTRTGSLPPPSGPDVAAAAAAAYAALSQSNDSTMIDRELLIKFLTNPSMLQNLSEKLAQNPPGTHGSSIDQSPTGNGVRGNARLWNTTSLEQNKGGQRYVETASTERHSSHGYDRPPGFGVPAGSNGLGQAYSTALRPPLDLQSLPQQSISPPISAAQPIVSVSGRNLSRDEYYKDLISQHGRKNEENLWGGAGGGIESETSYPGSGRGRSNGIDRDRKLEKLDRSERSERLDSGARWAERDVDMMDMGGRPGEESRSGQSRGKSRKACIYFTTSRGCRNGNSCAFVHESNNNGERAKRPKFEGKESTKAYSRQGLFALQRDRKHHVSEACAPNGGKTSTRMERALKSRKYSSSRGLSE